MIDEPPKQTTHLAVPLPIAQHASNIQLRGLEARVTTFNHEK